ncbi:MAG TPA: rhomboid family intramembrane serine protease [Terriglobales bacterium]|nr:rhomboid family intramembrane serine protease [Terriglobales bacterium]
MGQPQQTCADCQRSHPPVAQPTPLRRQPYSYRDLFLSLTGVLVGLNILVYLLMVLKGASPTSPTAEQIIRWGANYGPLTMNGQWWRLLTCAFVHIGILHLAFNMWALLNVGYLSEVIYGKRTFLLIYLGTAIAGSLGSLVRSPVAVSAGASGAIFGIAGALITTLHFGHLPFPRQAAGSLLRSLLIFAGYNLVFGIVQPGIDNGAHLGGFIFGLLAGAALGRHLGASEPAQQFRRVILVGGVAVLLAAGALVWKKDGYLAQLESAREELNSGKTDQALRTLNVLRQRKPGDPAVLLLLGDAYVRKGQMDEAENTLKQVVQSNPQSAVAWDSLGHLYFKQAKWEEASDAFAKAAQFDPKAADSWYYLGLTLQRQDRHAQAIEALRTAVKLRPDSGVAAYALGISAMSLKRYDEAIAAFQQAVKAKPNDADWHTWLANAYDAKGMQNESQAAYQRALELRTAQMRQKRIPR